MELASRLLRALAFCLVLPATLECSTQLAAEASAPPVIASESARSIRMDDGYVAIVIGRDSGRITSIVYRRAGTAMQIGVPGRSMYFDANAGAPGLPASLQASAPRAGYIDLGAMLTSTALIANSTEGADAELCGGPTTYFPFTVEVHFVMHRGVSGFYCYVVYRHATDLPAATLGQTRFVLRSPPGTALFTNHVVDAARQGPFDNAPIVRAVSDATFLLADGRVYCKYDNSAFVGNNYVHGMAGHGVGVWAISPSNEYVNGGPVKQELTVHRENTLLEMLQGGHYGAGSVAIDAGEAWTKIYGPFLIYLNSGATVPAMYSDAERQARLERSIWPYRWLTSADYPIARGDVCGRLRLTDGSSTSGATVVLAAPGGEWPMQAKGYEFWARVGRSGEFDIPKVRPGPYALYAYGANQFEQLERERVSVRPGVVTDLGPVAWVPVTHGRTIWQIGTPDRSTQEFRGGEDNCGPDGMRHWANFMRYPAEFPDDVTYTIGTSVPGRDWNFAQWTWYCKKPYWTIRFSLPTAPHGTATLTLGIAASNPLHGRHTNTRIAVNSEQVAVLHLPKSGAAAYRSGGQDSDYRVEYVTFSASLLHKGANAITIGDLDAAPFPDRATQMRGRVGAVMYDAIRLEIGP